MNGGYIGPSNQTSRAGSILWSQQSLTGFGSIEFQQCLVIWSCLGHSVNGLLAVISAHALFLIMKCCFHSICEVSRDIVNGTNISTAKQYVVKSCPYQVYVVKSHALVR